MILSIFWIDKSLISDCATITIFIFLLHFTCMPLYHPTFIEYPWISNLSTVMDIMIIRSVYLLYPSIKNIFNIKPWYLRIIPEPNGHKYHNLGRKLYGHYHHVFSLYNINIEDATIWQFWEWISQFR